MSSEAARAAAHETINELFNKIIAPLFGTMVTPVLVEPDNIDDRVNTLVYQFNENPSWIVPFRTLVQGLQKKEEQAALEEQIRFFQTNQTRYWLMVNLFNNVLNLKELKLDHGSGRLPGKPQALLKFSHNARTALGEESRYKDLMGAAGLIFDFLYYLQKTNLVTMGHVKLDETINTWFMKAIDQAKLITRLSRHKPNLTNEKHAPVIPLLRQLAQICLCIIHPKNGPDFYKRLGAMAYTEPLKLAMEMREFGVNSSMVASYLAQSFPIFDPLGEVMSVFGMTHVAHYTQSAAIYDLAGIGELGVVLKETYKINDFSETVKVGASIPELRFLDYLFSPAVRADLGALIR